MAQLQNITPDSSCNVGGLELCFFVPEEDIDSFPVSDGLVLRGDIVLKPGKVWYVLGYSRFTSRYEHKLKNDFRGGTYSIEQKGFIPTDSPALGNQLLYMKGRRFVLLFRDNNKYLRVTPPGYACTFVNSFETQDKPSDLKGYDLSFEAQTPWPAFYYSGGFTASELGMVQPPTGGSGSAEPVTILFNGTQVKLVPAGETLEVTSPYSLAFNIKFA